MMVAERLERRATYRRRSENMGKRLQIERKFPPKPCDIKELQRLAADAVAKQLLAKERSDS